MKYCDHENLYVYGIMEVSWQQVEFEGKTRISTPDTDKQNTENL